MEQRLTIEQVKEEITSRIKEYESSSEEYIQEMGDEEQSDICSGKASALKELLEWINKD